MTEYEQLRAAIDSKLAVDPSFRAVVRRIENGTATFEDTFEYSRLLSHITGKELSSAVLGLTDREGVSAQLLRDSYDDINEMCSTVQRALDEKAGIRIRPQKAEYPAERVKQFVHSLVDPTVEDSVIKRRANNGTANISMSHHDDYIKRNAAFRNDAGLKCYIERTSTGKCCEWCSDIAGRYPYSVKEMPEDIFRRHDNCTCKVIFENGRQRQDVWTKRTWEAPEIGVGSEEPTILTQEQARALEQRNLQQFRGLTNVENSDKIKAESELGKFKENIRNDSRMSKEYYSAVKNKFSHGSDDAKALFNKYVNGRSVENAAYVGTAHFNPDSKKISMNYYADLHNNRGKCVTWFHEHGHYIDNAAGNISNNAEFRKLLGDDYLTYMRSYGKKNRLGTFDKIQAAISSDLNSMRKHSAVSDIMQGISKGNVQGIAGHSFGYWKDDSVICSEAFAHMFEAQFDQTRYKEMKKYFPNALNKFEEMIGGLLK